MSNEEFTARCQELKQMSQNIRSQLSRTIEGLDANQGSPANLPAPRRSPDDVIIPVRQPGRPASMREAIPYINVPGPDETWHQLNEWRASYGLSPFKAPA